MDWDPAADRVRANLVQRGILADARQMRTFTPAGGMALLRRSLLKDWPPRYTEAPPVTASAQEAVLETTDEAQTLEMPLRRTRVRTLLKPDPTRRRRAA